MKKILIVYDLDAVGQKDKCVLVEPNENETLKKQMTYIKFIGAKNIRYYYLDTDLKRIEEL